MRVVSLSEKSANSMKDSQPKQRPLSHAGAYLVGFRLAYFETYPWPFSICLESADYQPKIELPQWLLS